MINGKLYSVWIGDEPSPALSIYPDDGAAMNAFRSLVLTVRADIEVGMLESGCDADMVLFCHGYYYDDGCIRGFVNPVRIMSAVDVLPESDGECEVIE